MGMARGCEWGRALVCIVLNLLPIPHVLQMDAVVPRTRGTKTIGRHMFRRRRLLGNRRRWLWADQWRRLLGNRRRWGNRRRRLWADCGGLTDSGGCDGHAGNNIVSHG